MNRCNDMYEIVTVYYPTSCFTTTKCPTTTTTSTSSSTSTTSTTTVINYNSYQYQGTISNCDTCVNEGTINFYNSELLTIDKWYIYTSNVGNSYKIQILVYIGPSITTAGISILDSTKQDTCGELPPCP